eukprot:1156184-Pelagomonas_calceolata.AAC.23
MHPLGTEASGEGDEGHLQTSARSSDSSDSGSPEEGFSGEFHWQSHGQPPSAPGVDVLLEVGSLQPWGAVYGSRSVVQRSRDVFAQPEYGMCLAGVAHYLVEVRGRANRGRYRRDV